MAILALVSAKTSPGATTTATALALTWPAPVLLVGADPAGDDSLSGYLGPWIERGWVHPGKGIVSFATATRHAEPGHLGDLVPHSQLLPGARNARVLAGLGDPAQSAAVGPEGWRRLGNALAATAGPGSASDAIVDLGRFGPATPRGLLEVADLVLVAVRPQRRSVLATRPLLRLLRQLVPAERLGLAVLATVARQATDVEDVLKVPVGVQLPEDAAAAHALSDPTCTGLPHKSVLLRTAMAAATRLHHALNQPPVPQAHLVGAKA